MDIELHSFPITSLAAYATGIMEYKEFMLEKIIVKQTYCISKKPACRLCKKQPKYLYACPNCKQRFCIVHLLSHIKLFKRFRDKLTAAKEKQGFISCHHDFIPICKEIEQYLPLKTAYKMGKHIKSNILQIENYEKRDADYVYNFLTAITKPSNISGISKLFKQG